MALQTKVGSLAQPTGTGNQAYTGVGFQPKALLFFYNALTADGTAVHAMIGTGVAVSSSSRAAVCTQSDDAVATADSNRRHDNTKCVTVINNAGTVLAAADLVTMDSDGFTLNWTTADATQRIINYIALGGTDLTNVAIKEITTPAGTGNQAYTGVGFQPDCIIGMSPAINAAPPGSAQFGTWGMGWGKSSSVRGSVGHSGDVSASAIIQSSFQTATLMTVPSVGSVGAILNAFDLVSMDADGFTVNWSTVGGTRYFWMLCLKGGSYAIGTVTQPTSTGNQAISGLGFQPTGLILAGNHRISAGVSEPWSTSIGFASATTARGSIWAGNTNAATDTADSALIRTKVYTNYTDGTPTKNAEADLQSFDSDGFTLNWSTVDSTQRLLLYLAFGSTSLATNTKTFTTDAIVKGTNTTTFTADGIVGFSSNFTRYILNGTGIPRPSFMRREFVQVKSDLDTINGRTTRDFSAVKEKFILRWDYLSQDEIDLIMGIVNLNTAVTFQIAENNLTVNSTSVLPFLSVRDYPTPAGSFYEAVELELVEVS